MSLALRCSLPLCVLLGPLVASTAHADPPELPQATNEGSRSGPGSTPDEAPSLTARLRPMSVADQVFTASLAAGVIVAAAIPYPSQETASWRGAVLFDDEARQGLLLRSFADRRTAASVSDGLMIGLGALPLVLDSALIAWAARGDLALAARMLVIDLQAHAFAQGLTSIMKHAVRRERPMARACREDAGRRAQDPSCEGSADPGIAPESFFSGHTSLAFTSAALICLHHTELGLFGEAGDAAMCATGLALASTVGLLRIVSDRHYASDVLVGAGVGLLSGWLVPWLLHYDIGDGPADDGSNASIAPMVDQNQLGMQIFGVF